MFSQQTSPVLQRLRTRAVTLSAYAVAFMLFCRYVGQPTDINEAVAWLWLATICWRIDRPFREHLRFFRDWLPVALVLTAYDLTRGFADNGAKPHVQEMIRFDRWLAGGHDLPTLWLQRHFYDVNTVHWWDVIVSAVYFSHFIATPVAAMVLWMRNREQWTRFTRRWITLSIAGLATYFLFPAAPPWWAAYFHLIAPVDRISNRG